METETALISFRIGERILMTGLISVSAVVMMFLYRKKIQNIDINVENDKGIIKTNLSFVMPIFLLLSLILYTFIILSHPISLRLETPNIPDNIQNINKQGTPNPQHTNKQGTLNPQHINKQGALNPQHTTKTEFVGFMGNMEASRNLTRNLHYISILKSNLSKLSNLGKGNKQQQATLKEELARLNVVWNNGLARTEFDLLKQRFKGDKSVITKCMPSILEPEKRESSKICHDFNLYLFGES